MDHGATAIIGPSRQDWLFALQEINDTSLNTYLVMVVTRVLKHTFFFSFFRFKIKSALIRYSMKTEKYSLRNLKREADFIVFSMKDETTNEIQVKIRHALKIFLRSQF